MTYSDGLVWADGHLHDPGDVRVSPFDQGLTVGDGVFETMKVVAGQAFALSRHLRRLRHSAEGLGLALPFGDDQLRDAVGAVVAANHVESGRLRITVTGGAGPLGSNRGGDGPTVLVASAPLPEWEPKTSVITVPWRRNEHSAVVGLKTTSYAENVVALARAHEAGATEAIFANTTGDLCEGTGSNVFLEVDGRLATPPLSSGCLAGITRELLLEALDIAELAVPLEQLAVTSEAFLTSSTRDVQSIAVIDGRQLPVAPGPLTLEAAEALAALERRALDP